MAKSGCGATGAGGAAAALVVRAARGAAVATEAGGATSTAGVPAGVCWDPSLAADRVGRVDEGISCYSQYDLSALLFFSLLAL